MYLLECDAVSLVFTDVTKHNITLNFSVAYQQTSSATSLRTSNLVTHHLFNDRTLGPLEVTSFTKSTEAKNK